MKKILLAALLTTHLTAPMPVFAQSAPTSSSADQDICEDGEYVPATVVPEIQNPTPSTPGGTGGTTATTPKPGTTTAPKPGTTAPKPGTTKPGTTAPKPGNTTPKPGTTPPKTTPKPPAPKPPSTGSGGSTGGYSGTNPNIYPNVPGANRRVDGQPVVVRDNGVNVNGLNPQMRAILDDIYRVADRMGMPTPVITSARDGHEGKVSKHNSGGGIDLRCNNASDAKCEAYARELQRVLGSRYWVDFEHFPNNTANDHIHIQYPPKGG